jgi:ABC-type siderophore export system fused ATPase/permease subunit
LNLEIKKGEVIFVTGGNGSGKSTFVNLITGLYQPTAGKVWFNNQVVKKEWYSYYSDQISAIFTSNYLFSENYDGFDLKNQNKKLTQYIELMKMSGIVRINEAKNRLETKLSKGQQKRLAMIYAMLEEKEILVLDEWAAEQDPHFREYFYTELIPELHRAGKTIIVITHDDAYYSGAERLIKFDYGKIISDKKTGNVRKQKTGVFIEFD